MTIRSLDKDFPFDMGINTKEAIDKKDLIEECHPVIKWLIHHLVSRPVYYGAYVDATIKIAGEEIQGIGVYEFMLFRK